MEGIEKNGSDTKEIGEKGIRMKGLMMNTSLHYQRRRLKGKENNDTGVDPKAVETKEYKIRGFETRLLKTRYSRGIDS